MAVLIRVDVDNAYAFHRLDSLKLNHPKFPGLSFLWYLRYLQEFVEYLDKKSVSASFFFKKTTVPKGKLLSRILEGHAVAFHAVRSENLEDFSSDFNSSNQACNLAMSGFSKHGSGELRESNYKDERFHTWQYSEEKCLKYAQELGLKYFSGNRENPELKAREDKGVMFYPAAFWVREGYREKKFDVAWLEKNSKKRDIVVLVHPVNWCRYSQVKSDFEKILSADIDFALFENV